MKMKMNTLRIFFISLMAAILLLVVSLTTVSAVEETYAECIDTGYIPPCLANDGSVTYSCDDPKWQANPTEGGCIVGEGQGDPFPKAETTNKPPFGEPAVTGPSDEFYWNSVTNNGQGWPEGDDQVRILVYVDVLTADNDPSFSGDARVCIETKGGIHGDAAECDEGMKTAGNMTTYVPFAITTKETDEGVYLPEGREFFACVDINTIGGQNKHVCAPSKNGEGNDVIGVHVPISH